jgi:hypothetical protein
MGWATNFRGFGAGIRPASQLHPFTVDFLNAQRLWGQCIQTKSCNEFLKGIISIGEQRPDNQPVDWPGNPSMIHWRISEPIVDGTPAAKAFAFRRTFGELENRIKRLRARAGEAGCCVKSATTTLAFLGRSVLAPRYGPPFNRSGHSTTEPRDRQSAWLPMCNASWNGPVGCASRDASTDRHRKAPGREPTTPATLVAGLDAEGRLGRVRCKSRRQRWRAIRRATKSTRR